MNKYFILIILITALLVGCSAPVTPAQTPIASPTEVFPTLTATPPPTATEKSATPTLTPEPALRTDGPYFAYFRQVDGQYQLVMMDADGGGRKAMDLPQSIVDALPNKQNDLDVRLISPDGKYLAFYTGSAGNFGFGNDIGNGPFDLTLNLLDLTTGQSSAVTTLLSKDYPNNFAEAEKQINKPDITSTDLRDAFLNGITKAIAWSPRGRYLAFAGQMDGLSSDLYVYDTTTKAIRRLSSGEQELQWISWSPDGKWVVHSSVYSVGEGMTFDIYTANIDGSSVRYMSTNSLYSGVEKWLNPHIYFENDSQNGPGDYGLRLVDIDTGKITKIWDGAYFSYEVDKDGQRVLVNAMLPDKSPYLYSGNDPNFRPGPYLIDVTTLKKTKVEISANEILVDYTIFPFDLMGQRFILMGNQSQSYFLSDKLELSSLDLNDAEISISPNRSQWVAVESTAINVYSADNVLTNSISLHFSDANRCDLAWMREAMGLFLVCGSNISTVNFSNSEIHLIETNRLDSYYGPKFIWIASQ